jgi:ATP-dependent Clp protease ATP-binding subunit ClpA
MINLAHFDAHARTVLVEARRRTLMKHRRAIGSQHVLAALVDSNDLDDIMEKAGVQRASVVAHLGEAPPSAEQLLMELGIDLPAVRSTLPDSVAPPQASGACGGP